MFNSKSINLSLFFNGPLIGNIVLLVFMAVYAVFTIILTVQVNTMNKTIAQFKGSSIIRLLTTINALAAISLFIISIVIL